MKSPIQRQMELFSAALEHPAGPERDAFLQHACADDAALLECVRTLLAGHSQAGSFLAQPAGPVGPSGTHLLPSTEKPGDKIGRYKLLQQIGEGGCGTVYMAEQEEPVRRRVALKVIRLGMDTKSVIARFEAERQALALMDHPNIAKVFDGGATENGRPYFVMELVRGIKITEYCDQAHLSTGERLQLFTQVCQAVQHAHQKGIIHRDIKPSNILVTVNDGVAVPKVIDFGIAKATDQRLTDKTYFTEFHAFIGTPAYTSPEQAEMSSLDIDTRSDIYSLGVLLYEMLTGHTPFPAERLLHSGLDEMRRIIREEEPPRPSTRLTTLPLADASELSRKRQLKIPALANAVEGDLDWIVMKALEKDRTRRYATSLDFAADIQRHLDNEPVHAGAPSQLYKFQKLVRRNKGAFAAAAAVFLALLTGLGLTAWQAVRASRAEHAARAQSEQARADRDRAVLAESNATEKATVATNALLTANERMVKLNVAEGWRRVEEGDHFGALLPFAEAFALEQDKPDRAEIHQMRLASVLQHCPKLVNVWSVGTNINDGEMRHAEFSRDGSRLFATFHLSDFSQNAARIWESATGRPLTTPMKHQKYIVSAQWSADETRIVTGSYDGRNDGTAQIWEAATGRPLGIPLIHGSTRVRFSRDGTRVLTLGSDRSSESDRAMFFEMWNVQNSELVWSNRIADTKGILLIPMLLSPDGDKVITSRTIYDARTGVALKNSYSESSKPGSDDSAMSDEDLTHAAEYSPDGSRLFLCHDSWATLRDGRDVERVIKRWSGPEFAVHGRFSPDGSLLATVNSSATVRIWNAVDGTPIASPLEHRDYASDVRFSPDGHRLATGTRAGEARVWDASTGRPITPWLIHDSKVLRVAFSADGTRLFVACENGSVAVWDMEGIEVPRFTWVVPKLVVPIDWKSYSSRPRLNSDGKALLTQTTNLAAIAWSLLDGSPLLPPVTQAGIVTPTSSHLIVRDGSAWSVISLKDGSTVTHPGSNYWAYPWKTEEGGLSDNGRWLICRKEPERDIVVLDAVSGEQIANLGSTYSVFNDPIIRPDGQQVVALLDGGQLAHWSLSSPEKPTTLRTGGSYCEYSPGGRWLLSKNGRDMAGTRVFDSSTFQEVSPKREDGWYLGTISRDDNWTIMDVDSGGGRILCLTNWAISTSLLRHRGQIIAHAFGPNSTFVVTAGADMLLKFWAVPSGDPLSLPILLPSDATDVMATGDGRGFVTVHSDDTLRFWELPKGQRPVSDWLALARFFAKGRGEVLGGTGDSPVPVGDPPTGPTAAHLRPQAAPTTTNAQPPGGSPGGTGRWPVPPQPSFHAQWLALRAKHPEVFTVSADEIDAWHRHEAWRGEARRDWSNAVTHLSALLETHPDSGDFLPRRAAAHVAWAAELVAAEATERGLQAASTPENAPTLKRPEGRAPQGKDQILPTSAATNHLMSALADYTRTLAWVDRFPAIAKESRRPFVEKRREVYLKLGRKTEADADERELKGDGK